MNLKVTKWNERYHTQRIYTVSFHLNEILDEANSIYSDKKRICGCLMLWMERRVYYKR